MNVDDIHSRNVVECEIDDDGFTTDDNDLISTTSTIYSSNRSSISSNATDTQSCSQSIHELTSEHIGWGDVIAPKVTIGNVALENGVNVTVGNHIVIEGPAEVVIENKNEPNALTRFVRFISTHPCQVCSMICVAAMLITTLLIAGYFFDPFSTETTCEIIPFDPGFYSCAFASPCIRCEAMYSHTEICSASYEHSCGSLQCFCKPNCLSTDCVVRNHSQW